MGVWGESGFWLRVLLVFISAKEGRSRHSYFQVVRVRLVGRCDVLINQQTDVFKRIQPFALQHVNLFVNKAYLESFVALGDQE